MNTAPITTPAKVARIGKSRPAPQYHHGDHSDNRSAHGHVSMGMAAAMPAAFVFIVLGGVAFFFWK